MDIIQSLWDLVVTGGPGAVSGFLLACILYLIQERHKLLAMIEQYQHTIEDNRNQYSDSIIKIIDRYHEGNLQLIQALNEIKLVLSTMHKTML